MKTITLRLPETLEMQLNAYATARGISRSEILRQALAEYISKAGTAKPDTLLELTKDLAGSVQGPSDLSSNKEHLDNYGK